MNLADFASYCDAKRRAESTYADREKFMKMSLKNIANAGVFASDRSVTDYAKNIWNTKPVL